jgi:hypothetical protein
MRSAISFILLLAAYVWLSSGVGITLFLLVVHPNWPGSEYTKGVGYIVLLMLAGATAVWAGRRLWFRWRTALGWIALIVGSGAIAEGVRMNAPMSFSLITSNALGVLAGIGLLLTRKFSART